MQGTRSKTASDVLAGRERIRKCGMVCKFCSISDQESEYRRERGDRYHIFYFWLLYSDFEKSST
jgi:hypothetical protein